MSQSPLNTPPPSTPNLPGSSFSEGILRLSTGRAIAHRAPSLFCQEGARLPRTTPGGFNCALLADHVVLLVWSSPFGSCVHVDVGMKVSLQELLRHSQVYFKVATWDESGRKNLQTEIPSFSKGGLARKR